MHLKEEIRGETAVVSLKGNFLDDSDDFMLREKITSLTSDGIRRIVFDLGKVNHLNSTGLGALIWTAKTMRALGGDVRLAQLDKNLSAVFVSAKLVHLFETYETVGRALGSYMN